jgi:TP901 family phage tail tape measure protein
MSVFNLMATLGLDSTGFDQGLNDSESKLTRFGSTLKRGAGAALKMTGAALTAASTAVVGFAKTSVDAGMQFDSSMSQVAATMGVTVDEIQDLRDFAMEMGAKTAFSASQAADALNYMALAGYDAETSMSMLPNVLNLAASGGIELARASDMVTDAASALGLSLDETSHMVDVMAKVSSTANTSVDQLGEAILTVGGTAKNLKYGTDELAQVLGLLADNGIKGAEGGTVLRNIILSLASPTKEATKALQQLGVTVYDEQGNMRDMQSIFEDLSASLSELSQGEQTQALSKIFNKVDLKGVNALLGTTSERWDEVYEATQHAAGAAEQMAATQLDNLAGDVTLFQSALEGAKITISDQLTPSLREFVQFGTSGIGQIAEAFSEGGLVGAMGKLGEVLAEGLSKVIDKAPELIDAASSLVVGIANGIASNADKLAPAAVKAVVSFGKAILSNISVLISTVSKVIVSLAGEISNQLPTIITEVVSSIISIANTILDHLPELLTAVLDVIVSLASALINEGLPLLLAALPDIITGIVNFVLGAIPQILDAVMAIIDGIVQATPQIVLMIVEMIPTIIENLVLSLLEHIPDIIEAGTKLIGSLFSGDITANGSIIAAIPRLIIGLVKMLTDPKMIQKLLEAGWTLLEGLLNGLVDIGTKVWEACQTVINAIVTYFKRAWSDIKEVGTNVVRGIWEGIKGGADWIWNKVKEWFGGLFSKIKDFLGIASPSKLFRDVIGKNLVLGLAEGIDDNADTAIGSMLDLADELVQAAEIGDVSYGGSFDAIRHGGTGGIGGGVRITQNIYAERMTPAQVFDEAVNAQERLVFLGLA